MPKLDVVGFNVLLCNFDRGGVVRTFKFDAAQDIAVGPHYIEAVLWHRIRPVGDPSLEHVAKFSS